jgi:hypothetical protein
VFYVFTSGENVLDRVKWHMKAWRKSFNLSQFSTYFEKENPCACIWKHERFVVVPSNEKLSIEAMV